MSTLNVVTVTLNPALDMTGVMGELNVGSVNVISSSNLNPGGKGINVAKVMADLGANVTVTGFLGDENQDPFVHLFEKQAITDKFVRVAGASRINVKLVEEEGRVTDLNFPGVEVSEKDISAFEATLFSLADTHEVFVIAGSLPRGISPETLKCWLLMLHEKGKKVFFDSSHAALAEGLKAAPWLIKPNDDELSQWANQKLTSQYALMQTGEALAETGIQNVVISRGADGVLWFANGEWFQSQPPKMQVVSTVGAGDTLVAGMCWGELNQWPHEQTLGFATALSALAVTQVNVGIKNMKDVDDLKEKICVKKLTNDSE